MVVWAGRIMMLQGIVHLLTTGMRNTQYFGQWLSGELWFPDFGIGALPPEAGAFWLVPGSFGLPLLLLGAVVSALGKHGLRPPMAVAWAYGLWGVVCGVIFEPSPFFTTLVPLAMLVVDSRRRSRRGASEPATAVA